MKNKQMKTNSLSNGKHRDITEDLNDVKKVGKQFKGIDFAYTDKQTKLDEILRNYRQTLALEETKQAITDLFEVKMGEVINVEEDILVFPRYNPRFPMTEWQAYERSGAIKLKRAQKEKLKQVREEL